MIEYPLGRRVATDQKHVERYPLRTVQPETVSHVEKSLDINTEWRIRYDQGAEGACVGFASSMVMSILNRTFYDAVWHYRMSQEADEFPDTPPSEGTSVRAGMDVLRIVGHRRRIFSAMGAASFAPDLKHGILANRWARNVDELRTSVANNVPAVLGCAWFADFDRPQPVRTWRNLGRAEWWIGRDRDKLGVLRGGHAITVFGASDRRQAFKLCNSWGLERIEGGRLIAGYPLAWIPYDTVQLLLNYDGECTVITDRPDVPKGDQ